MKKIILLNLVTVFTIVFLSCVISVAIMSKITDEKIAQLQTKVRTSIEVISKYSATTAEVEAFKAEQLVDHMALKKRIQILEGQMVLLFPKLLEKR